MFEMKRQPLAKLSTRVANPMTDQAKTERSLTLKNIPCRLCGARADFCFQKTLLGKYPVSFFVCNSCGSMQTEEPYWIAEAYSPSALSIDPGAAQRVLDCIGLTHAILRLYHCQTSLDYGGGSGLLCRLLRDIGHDAYWYDGYTSPGYATGFESRPENYHDMVTSFEVVEHFANPKTDWDILFGARPKVVLIMTSLYQGQNPDWWYIAPEEGQHIFFYSRSAIQWIASRYDYVPVFGRGFVLFSREAPTTWQKFLLEKILTPKFISWWRLVVLARRTDAPQRDSNLLEERVRSAQTAPRGEETHA